VSPWVALAAVAALGACLLLLTVLAQRTHERMAPPVVKTEPPDVPTVRLPSTVPPATYEQRMPRVDVDETRPVPDPDIDLTPSLPDYSDYLVPPAGAQSERRLAIPSDASGDADIPAPGPQSTGGSSATVPDSSPPIAAPSPPVNKTDRSRRSLRSAEW
jgi:hypothetical protein